MDNIKVTRVSYFLNLKTAKIQLQIKRTDLLLALISLPVKFLQLSSVINSRTAIAGGYYWPSLGFLRLEEEYWFLRLEEGYWFLRLEEEYWFSLGLFLQEVDLFTRHFDPKAKVRKAVLVNRFSLSERSFLIMRCVY